MAEPRCRVASRDQAVQIPPNRAMSWLESAAPVIRCPRPTLPLLPQRRSLLLPSTLEPPPISRAAQPHPKPRSPEEDLLWTRCCAARARRFRVDNLLISGRKPSHAPQPAMPPPPLRPRHTPRALSHTIPTPGAPPPSRALVLIRYPSPTAHRQPPTPHRRPSSSLRRPRPLRPRPPHRSHRPCARRTVEQPAPPPQPPRLHGSPPGQPPADALRHHERSAPDAEPERGRERAGGWRCPNTRRSCGNRQQRRDLVKD
jgi:hypothetical protein